uniref:Uncharacterized protein n=1 Tax=Strombidium rassoulzadegani TaxID=1082188 RepID=A0A7S3CN76_9SPIT|mmetsp:Transcript_17800/g.30170  ORF Transcript_17800/g.30170 Transcript_17800/m.30170 type:complete len:112 (+) Transcript_17800:241-576(+)
MQFVLVFWAFTLVWKTFLFRFGLINRLLQRELPFLRLIPYHFLLLLAEKGFRIVYYLAQDGDPIKIYGIWFWHPIFWLKSLMTIICYAGCIVSTIKVMHPSYYKPYKWYQS